MLRKSPIFMSNTLQYFVRNIIFSNFNLCHGYLGARGGIFIYALNLERITNFMEILRNISSTNLKFHNSQNIGRVLTNSIYIMSTYQYPIGSTNNKLWLKVPWRVLRREGEWEGVCGEWILTYLLHGAESFLRS